MKNLIACVVFLPALSAFMVHKSSAQLYSATQVPESGTNDFIIEDSTKASISCFDISDHQVSFVTTEPGVHLEVLDWGGTGEYLVLLTGLGDNAHVYDHFAYQFTDLFQVIGITRRGFGRSSNPSHGYDVPTRALDIIKILDNLKISKANFAGHSIAGDELSELGADYPDRVLKLVYLDAYDYGTFEKLEELPPPDYTDSDFESVERFIATNVRYYGYRAPDAAVCNSFEIDSTGKIVDAISPPEIVTMILNNSQPAEFDRIKASALGLFDVLTSETRYPYFWYLTAEKQADYLQSWKSLSEWQNQAMERFRSGIKNPLIIELPDSYHYVFLTREAVVAREMRKFLLGN